MSDDSPSEAAASFQARLTKTEKALRIDQFVDLGPTPGNVGVCLAGGGSRALTAGMGQLRALRHLKIDGSDLVGLAKAMSTVSGGSWLGVTFEYLPADVTDDDYLNLYVPDPGRLVASKTDGYSVPETLDELPDGNIGNSIASPAFGPVALAIQAVILYKLGVPPDMLWQTAIATHILQPYGLYRPGSRYQPTSFFSYDRACLERDVLKANPDLAGETVHLFADQPQQPPPRPSLWQRIVDGVLAWLRRLFSGPTVSVGGSERTRRPFLICNTAMFLDEPGTAVRLLASVECTAFFTGIVGAPRGRDANGLEAGGGGVTSFAFNSNPTAVENGRVTVTQSRQWALMDIVGASSAFFAEILENQIAEWRQDARPMIAAELEEHEGIRGWIGEHLHRRHHDRANSLVDRDQLRAARDDDSHPLHSKLRSIVEEIQEVIPEYAYWPVRDAAPAEETQPTRFADGGNHENTGLGALLSYDDVDNAIVFVNSTTPLAAGAMGVIGADGKEIPDTRVIVDAQMPPLFGYQPYDKKQGYVLYEGAENPEEPVLGVVQVFPAGSFPEFLQGLWKVTGNSGSPNDLGATEDTPIPGADLHSPVLKQTLEVLDNRWFGVRGGGRKVGVLWLYLNRVKDWYDQLSPDVQEILGPFDDPSSFNDFPHYSTIRTHLSATELNLLAHLTAWCVANPANRQQFIDMFG